jgi:hypothetical protein
MRIMAGIGDLVQRTGDGQAQVGCSVAGQSRGQVMLCAVCIVHKELRSTGFLVEPQNQGRVSWFGLKTKVDDFSRFSLKSGIYGLVIWASKLGGLWFVGYATKLMGG